MATSKTAQIASKRTPTAGKRSGPLSVADLLFFEAQARRKSKATGNIAPAAPSTQAKTEHKTTPFATKRQEALEHEKAGRWEQAAQCWLRAGELARAVSHKQEAAGRAAAARVRAEPAQPASATPVAEPLAPRAGEPTPAIPDGPPLLPAPTSEAGAPAEEVPVPSASKPAEKAPPQRDERLPPPGTVLRRVDRHGNVRCECTVEEHGIRYAGTMYKTLSAAAIAAAKDLGFQSASQNGFLFWQLAKPARPEGSTRSTLDGLERAWKRYHEHAQAAARSSDGEARAKVYETLHTHLNVLFAIVGAP